MHITQDVTAFLFRNAVDLTQHWNLDIFKAYLEKGYSFTGPARKVVWKDRISLRAEYFLAFVLAIFLIVLTHLRVSVSKFCKHGLRRSEFVALHLEDSTRTRYLLRVFGSELKDYSIIILGRYRPDDLAAFEVQLGKLCHLTLAEIKLVWPHDRPSFIFVFGSLFASYRSGLEVLQIWLFWTRSRLGMRSMTGLICRVLLGQSQSKWWERRAGLGSAVVFAHTGTADTTQLELSIQKASGKTLHLLHGVSTGYAFYGKSNALVCQNKHDEQWMQVLGGYQSCSSFGIDAPSSVAPDLPGRGRFLVLSNLLNPMGVNYLRHGLVAEQKFLQVVVEGIGRAAVPGAQILWRPHPTFSSLPASEQQEMLRFAEGLGVTPLCGHAEPLEQLVDGSLVISTISSVILDVLLLGCLPMVYLDDYLDSDRFYGAISPSVCVRTPAQVTLAITALSQPEQYAALYQKTWCAIGPARQPRPAEIFSLLGSLLGRAQ